MFSSMTVQNTDANLEVYSSPDVAAYYQQLEYVAPAERFLFERYVKQGDAILDLGVGGGRTTPYLSALASFYVGVDYSESMVQVCRAKFPGISFCVADVANLAQFADHSFDVAVMAFNGLDYVMPNSKRQRALMEVARVLKPGGIFIFSSHNPRAILQRPSWNPERIGTLAETTALRGTPMYQTILFCLTIVRVGFAYVKALAISFERSVRRLTSRAFWAGDGWMMDSAHGGLMTHYAIPKRVVNELVSANLKCQHTVGNDYPDKSKDLWTEWYYYAARSEQPTEAKH